jgi:hypothetical protein
MHGREMADHVKIPNKDSWLNQIKNVIWLSNSYPSTPGTLNAEKQETLHSN